MSLLNLLEEFVMFEKIRKMKNKKGFTLVELIVVLVILAILAALLIPALTGYIDRAREEAIVTETRQTLMAIQTEASSLYGHQDAGSFDPSIITYEEVKALSETTGSYHAVISSDGKVKDLTYVNSDGKYTCVYDADGTTKFDVSKNSTAAPAQDNACVLG